MGQLYVRNIGETGNGSAYGGLPLMLPSTTYSFEFRYCVRVPLPGTTEYVIPCGPWVVGSGRTRDKDTPTPVVGVSATSQTSSSINLTWGAPSPSDSEWLVDNYELRIAGLGTRIVPAKTYTYDWDGLTPGTEYQVEIRACNYSACSEFTPPITVTTLGS
jgi:hypothetical protein